MSTSRMDIMRQFLPTSPYVGHLGMQLTEMQQDMAVLTLPFAQCARDHRNHYPRWRHRVVD